MYALFTFFLPLVSHILKYIRDCYWAQLVFSLNIRSRSSSLHLYSFSVLMHIYICILSNERNTFTILTVFVIGSHNTHSIKIFPFSHTHKYITTYYNFRQSLDILLRITICSSTKRNNNWKPISKRIHTFPIADAAIVVVQPFSFGIVSNEHSHIGFLVLIFYCCVAMCVSVWVCVSFDDRS